MKLLRLGEPGRERPAVLTEVGVVIGTTARYISTFTVPHPGDLINTGTPAGVGLGLRPQRFINPGDVTQLRATGLGTQRQRFVPAP